MKQTGRPSRSVADRVLLISMPFGPVERPSLALGLLHAHCARLGIECRTSYLNLEFAELVGMRDYGWLSGKAPYTAFAGEWVFAEAVYGPRPSVDERYLARVMSERWRSSDHDIQRLQRIREAVPGFLDRSADQIVADGYTLVGFTSVFQQNLASLALGARLKQRSPDITLAFGGANLEEPMGSALRRQFPFMDLTFSGEADRSWPAVLQARRDGRTVEGIPGIAAAGVSKVEAAERVDDLDELPVPDFDPYFEQLRSASVLVGVQPTLLVETARGCWWGERSQCTFCGLNGSSMSFRSKSPERAVAEITDLRGRYAVGTISVVDDILDMRYLRTVLPRLAEERLAADLFWEVKANLTFRQVAQLRAAGVRFVQPGIESLNDHVLQLMRKGTTAARNIELLKWCSEYRVIPLWNLLYGFPGETTADYDGMVPVIKAIWHLTPPSGYGPIRLDRFSPYHSDPQAFGMVNVRPMDPLPDLYPFDLAEQTEIAYYFDFDYADGRAADEYAGETIALIREWISDTRRGALWMSELESGLHIVDSRRQLAANPHRFVLSGWKSAVYSACDRAQHIENLTSLSAVADAGVSDAELLSFLHATEARQLAIQLGDTWLNLAVHTPARPLGAPSRPLELVAATS
jgi:ribosomal peptide maturation radical SAM protein 1